MLGVPEQFEVLDVDQIKKLINEGLCNEYHMEAKNRGIKKLIGLSKVKKLRSIDLGFNKIEDCFPLCELPELRDIKLHSNELTNIDGLERCPRVEKLMLHNNNLKDSAMVSMARLKNLKSLRLDANKLGSLRCIKTNTSLVELDVSNNQLNSLDGVQHMIYLNELGFSHNEISSLECLHSCTGLTEIRGNDNHVKSLKGLPGGGKSRLQSLVLHRNHLYNVDSLPPLYSLTELHLSSNRLDNISRLLVATPNLDYLDIRNNRIDNLDDMLNIFQRLPKLTEVLLEGNPCTGISTETKIVTRAEKWWIKTAVAVTTLSRIDDLEVRYKDRPVENADNEYPLSVEEATSKEESCDKRETLSNRNTDDEFDKLIIDQNFRKISNQKLKSAKIKTNSYLLKGGKSSQIENTQQDAVDQINLLEEIDKQLMREEKEEWKHKLDQNKTNNTKKNGGEEKDKSRTQSQSKGCFDEKSHPNLINGKKSKLKNGRELAKTKLVPEDIAALEASEMMIRKEIESLASEEEREKLCLTPSLSPNVRSLTADQHTQRYGNKAMNIEPDVTQLRGRIYEIKEQLKALTIVDVIEPRAGTRTTPTPKSSSSRHSTPKRTDLYNSMNDDQLEEKLQEDLFITRSRNCTPTSTSKIRNSPLSRNVSATSTKFVNPVISNILQENDINMNKPFSSTTSPLGKNLLSSPFSPKTNGGPNINQSSSSQIATKRRLIQKALLFSRDSQNGCDSSSQNTKTSLSRLSNTTSSTPVSIADEEIRDFDGEKDFTDFYHNRIADSMADSKKSRGKHYKYLHEKKEQNEEDVKKNDLATDEINNLLERAQNVEDIDNDSYCQDKVDDLSDIDSNMQIQEEMDSSDEDSTCALKMENTYNTGTEKRYLRYGEETHVHDDDKDLFSSVGTMNKEMVSKGFAKAMTEMDKAFEDLNRFDLSETSDFNLRSAANVSDEKSCSNFSDKRGVACTKFVDRESKDNINKVSAVMEQKANTKNKRDQVSPAPTSTVDNTGSAIPSLIPAQKGMMMNEPIIISRKNKNLSAKTSIGDGGRAISTAGSVSNTSRTKQLPKFRVPSKAKEFIQTIDKEEIENNPEGPSSSK